MTKIEDYKPTLEDLIEAYGMIVRDTAVESGTSYDDAYKADNKAEAEIMAALAPLAHDIMAKMPHGKKYQREVATLIRETTKENRRYQAEAEAAGYPDYRTMQIAESKAQTHKRRSDGAKRAAAARRAQSEARLAANAADRAEAQ